MYQNNFQHSCKRPKHGIGPKDLLVGFIRSQCGKLHCQFPALLWVIGEALPHDQDMMLHVRS